MVLVTPRLVAAMNPVQVPALPGESWRHPSEVDLLLKGDIGGESHAAGPTTAPSSSSRPPRYYGQHGFVPVAAQQPEAK